MVRWKTDPAGRWAFGGEGIPLGEGEQRGRGCTGKPEGKEYTGKKGRLRVSPAAVIMGVGMLLLALWEGRPSGAGLTGTLTGTAMLAWGLAALCHEAGHLLAARLCRVGIRGITLDLFGARIHVEGLLSYGQECMISCAGPAVNFLTVAVAAAVAAIGPFWLTGSGPWQGFLALFLAASLGLGTVNLLPVSTLDGGRMLFCLLATLWGDGIARRVLSVTTGIVLVLLWLAAAYALLRVGSMLSLFVFSLCLLVRAVGRW